MQMTPLATLLSAQSASTLRWRQFTGMTREWSSRYGWVLEQVYWCNWIPNNAWIMQYVNENYDIFRPRLFVVLMWLADIIKLKLHPAVSCELHILFPPHSPSTSLWLRAIFFWRKRKQAPSFFPPICIIDAGCHGSSTPYCSLAERDPHSQLKRPLRVRGVGREFESTRVPEWQVWHSHNLW